MKGQRLFIRPIDAADHDAVASFLSRNGSNTSVPACGLLGKLVGDLVAVLAMRITPDSVEIEDILVTKELRRKRIGRAMIDEAEQIAARMERTQLVVAGTGDGDFLRRAGFDREGERWIRQVRAAHTEQR